MNDQQAYDKLLQDRPIIVAVLQNNRARFATPGELAAYVTNQRDSDELRRLISQAAAAMYGHEEAQP